MRTYRPLLVGLVAAILLVAGTLPRPSADGRPAQYAPLRILAEWDSDLDRVDFEQLLLSFFLNQNTAVDISVTTDIAGALERAIAGDAPPDVIVMAQPGLLVEAARAGALIPLDAAIGPPTPGYPDYLADALTVHGTVYGRFLRLSVDALAWHNPAALAAIGTPPESWDALSALAASLSAEGAPAWAISLAGESSTDVIETLLAREAGPDTIDALADGSLAWTDPQVRAAWEQFGALLDTGLAPDAAGLSVAEAVRAPFASPPVADLGLGPSAGLRWITNSTSLQPGKNVGFFLLPDANPDVVSVSGGFLVLLNDEPLTLQLAEFLTAPETAAAWAALGSGISPFPSTPYPSPVMERAASLIHDGEPVLDLSNRLPPAVQAAFQVGVLRYAEDRAALDTVLADIQAAAEDAS